MTTEQTAGTGRCGASNKTDNALRCHIFPAVIGRVAAPARPRRAPRQGILPCRQSATCRIVTPQPDAGNAILGNAG